MILLGLQGLEVLYVEHVAYLEPEWLLSPSLSHVKTITLDSCTFLGSTKPLGDQPFPLLTTVELLRTAYSSLHSFPFLRNSPALSRIKIYKMVGTADPDSKKLLLNLLISSTDYLQSLELSPLPDYLIPAFTSLTHLRHLSLRCTGKELLTVVRSLSSPLVSISLNPGGDVGDMLDGITETRDSYAFAKLSRLSFPEHSRTRSVISAAAKEDLAELMEQGVPIVFGDDDDEKEDSLGNSDDEGEDDHIV